MNKMVYLVVTGPDGPVVAFATRHEAELEREEMDEQDAYYLDDTWIQEVPFGR